ncbi:MAG: pimeloyl-ACP methyl ester carboxylesterase [Planctomycetota bacterium]|jgi:pimeloyl-ACP methyl ester carboxylesterase
MNWLFLKGLARSQAHWDRQPAVFMDHVPGARVHFLDLPGIGAASERRASWKMAEIADDLRERFLDLREADGVDTTAPWAILGISLGGMIAMEWIESHPTDFERAVIITSSAGNLSPPWKRMLPSVGPSYIRAMFAKDAQETERRSLAITTNDLERRDELVAAYIEIGKSCNMPIKVINRQLLAAIRWPAPAQLRIPTLFLGTEADHMVHPTCTPALAAHFDAPLRMHKTAGHEIPHDDPYWLADQVSDWLKLNA